MILPDQIALKPSRKHEGNEQLTIRLGPISVDEEHQLTALEILNKKEMLQNILIKILMNSPSPPS